MYEITGLTTDPKQSMKLIVSDGNLVTLTLEYVESQRGWFYSLDYLTYSLSRRRLVASPNMLRQFRGVYPFGIACNVTDGLEPIFKDDFYSGRVKIYILDPADILLMEAFILS